MSSDTSTTLDDPGAPKKRRGVWLVGGALALAAAWLRIRTRARTRPAWPAAAEAREAARARP